MRAWRAVGWVWAFCNTVACVATDPPRDDATAMATSARGDEDAAIADIPLADFHGDYVRRRSGEPATRPDLSLRVSGQVATIRVGALRVFDATLLLDDGALVTESTFDQDGTTYRRRTTRSLMRVAPDTLEYTMHAQVAAPYQLFWETTVDSVMTFRRTDTGMVVTAVDGGAEPDVTEYDQASFDEDARAVTAP